MNTEIQNISELTTAQLFQNNTSAGILASITKQALAIVPDITTAKGRDAVISQAAMIAKTKVAVEKVGKALVDPMKKATNIIDVERKFYKDGFDALRDEVRSPVTEWEREQDAMKAAIAQRIFELEQAGVTSSPNTGELLPLDSLARKLKFLESEAITAENYGESFNESEILRSAGITRVTGAMRQRKDSDELEQLRKDKAKRDADEAAEAVQTRIADAAVEKFKAAEAAKVEKPVSKISHVDASESNKRAAMNAAFMSMRAIGISKDTAQVLTKAIAAGEIENVSLDV